MSKKETLPTFEALDKALFETPKLRSKHNIAISGLKFFDSDGNVIADPVEEATYVYFVPVYNTKQLAAFLTYCKDCAYYFEGIDSILYTGGIYFYSAVKERNWDYIPFKHLDGIFNIIGYINPEEETDAQDEKAD